MALLSVTDALTTTRNSIPYWERLPVGERWVNDGSETVRRLFCYWRQRIDFIQDILGDARVMGGLLRRDLPEEHPELTGYYALSASLVEAEGWAGRKDDPKKYLSMHDSPPLGPPSSPLREPNDEGLAVYDVVYQRPLYEIRDDAETDSDPYEERSRYIIPSTEPAAENLPFPKGLLYFEDDTSENTAPELAPILFPSPMFNMEWVRVPVEVQMPVTWYGEYSGGVLTHGAVGSVNKYPFHIPRYGTFNEGTLLCLAPTIRLYQDANTALFQDITFHFQYRPQGHSRFLRNSGFFKKLLRKGSPSPDQTEVFAMFDFVKLFDVSLS